MSRRADSQRLFDLVGAAVGLVVTSPLWAGAAVGVRLSSPGPILHRAVRVGRDGVPFTLYKFRSMRTGAHTMGPGITVAGDARITRVGRVLRGTKLDELPQLLNVLKGEMSIVGPRPEDGRYVDQYTPAQREILTWRPGITSPASVLFRDEEAVLARIGGDLDAAYVTHMADKIEVDLRYFRERSVLGDLRLVAQTLAAIGRR